MRDLIAAERLVRETGAAFVSPGAMRLPLTALGYRGGLMVRDPDGHALLLVSS